MIRKQPIMLCILVLLPCIRKTHHILQVWVEGLRSLGVFLVLFFHHLPWNSKFQQNYVPHYSTFKNESEKVRTSPWLWTGLWILEPDPSNQGSLAWPHITQWCSTFKKSCGRYYHACKDLQYNHWIIVIADKLLSWSRMHISTNEDHVVTDVILCYNVSLPLL